MKRYRDRIRFAGYNAPAAGEQLANRWVDGVKQCLTLVGFGIALDCLPGMRSRNIEMIFAHFLFLLLHGLVGILPQTKR